MEAIQTAHRHSILTELTIFLTFEMGRVFEKFERGRIPHTLTFSTRGVFLSCGVILEKSGVYFWG